MKCNRENDNKESSFDAHKQSGFNPILTPLISHGTWFQRSYWVQNREGIKGRRLVAHTSEIAHTSDQWKMQYQQGPGDSYSKPVPFTPPIIQAMSSLPCLVNQVQQWIRLGVKTNRFQLGAPLCGQILTSLYRYLGWMNRGLPTRKEKGTEVSKVLRNRIIPILSCPITFRVTHPLL